MELKHGLQLPLQVGLPFYGREVDVDGFVDLKYKGGVVYMGKASHVFDNTYRCLAVCGGALCIVEASITFGAPQPLVRVVE
jgi:hypothetical protein